MASTSIGSSGSIRPGVAQAALAGTIRWGVEKTAHWLKLLNDHWLGGGKKYLTGDRITIADYLGACIVAVAEIVRYDISANPNVTAWHARMTALPHWDEVGAAIAGYAASVKDQPVVTA